MIILNSVLGQGFGSSFRDWGHLLLLLSKTTPVQMREWVEGWTHCTFIALLQHRHPKGNSACILGFSKQFLCNESNNSPAGCSHPGPLRWLEPRLRRVDGLGPPGHPPGRLVRGDQSPAQSPAARHQNTAAAW